MARCAVAGAAAPCWRGIAERHVLVVKNTGGTGNRRRLPTSPFKPPPEADPVERYELHDLVTHDKYGLGRVIRVEDDTAIVVDFAPRRIWITTPFARMSKL